jgi:hypothetical protein
VVTGANDGGGVHACVGPISSSRADGGAPSSDPVNYISLFKKAIVVTGVLLLWYNSDRSDLLIATVQP